MFTSVLSSSFIFLGSFLLVLVLLVSSSDLLFFESSGVGIGSGGGTRASGSDVRRAARMLGVTLAILYSVRVIMISKGEIRCHEGLQL